MCYMPSPEVGNKDRDRRETLYLSSQLHMNSAARVIKDSAAEHQWMITARSE